MQSDFLVPPEHLLFRVCGETGQEAYLDIGKKCLDDIQAALARVGRRWDSFRNILDFGCGCGRVLRWCTRLPGQRISGTDIDSEAIAK
jgi:methylase of polypeptide subunit release factors